MSAALILPLLTLAWEIVKAIFFPGSGGSEAAANAAIDRYRKRQAEIRAASKKADDTEGDTSELEAVINKKKP
jgi:hypothetical protein